MTFHSDILHRDPTSWLRRHRPEDPVHFFEPERLRASHAAFVSGFPGETTYAVKANPDPRVIRMLVDQGMQAFDVASIPEMERVRQALPEARLHYHNPVRAPHEVAEARRRGVLSWSVDRRSELDKLGDIAGTEIAVRFKLPVAGAAYDFGAKFGATPEEAKALMVTAKARGALVSITFHPGTQCTDAGAWARYIAVAADLSKSAGVTLHRLNLGGGFPVQRCSKAADLGAIFKTIAVSAQTAFHGAPPPLVCEPGRALAAEALTVALRVKAVDGETVFLNDGIYGALSEWRDIPVSNRITVVAQDAGGCQGPQCPYTVFGPTCDSLDRIPGGLHLPADLREGDYLLIEGNGAYSQVLGTRFNGYGAAESVTLPAAPTGHACPAV